MILNISSFSVFMTGALNLTFIRSLNQGLTIMFYCEDAVALRHTVLIHLQSYLILSKDLSSKADKFFVSARHLLGLYVTDPVCKNLSSLISCFLPFFSSFSYIKYILTFSSKI